MSGIVTDHDLLVTMHEQLKQVRSDIQELRDGFSAKLQDHEIRLRRLEMWGFILIGASYALQLYLNYLQ